MRLPRLTRRRFIGTAAGAAALTGLYAWRIEPHWLQIIQRDLPVRELPSALAGKKLVQISDLHVGLLVDPDYLATSLKTVSQLEPDLVVITGDLMSCEGQEQVEQVERALGDLAKPPLGCYGILGNHDYGHGWNNPDVAEAVVKRAANAGVHVLRNETANIGGLQLAGVDDIWGGTSELVPFLSQVDWSLPTIAMVHNPDAADFPGWQDHRGWILSGHTHGGQCKPPFLPPPILPVENSRYTAGEIDLFDGRRLYINRGLGYVRRVRFNVRPEITAFRLSRS